MSEPESTPERPAPVDLSDLRLMPDWVANFGRPQQAQRRHGEHDEHAGRKDRRGAGRRDGHGGPPFRDRRDERGGNRFDKGGQRGRREWKRGEGGRRGQRDGGRDFHPLEREPLPTDILVTLEPDDKTADALGAHIRATGRAFSIFDAARIVLDSGDRFHVKIACAAERPGGMFRVPEDGSLFLTRDEAVQHILHSQVLDCYYRSEDIELEEPKGEFKSVAVCGMSGELLGPPNHHSYQTVLLRLHRERFPSIPLEDYKHRVRVEHDPELVAKWKERQRKGTRWTYRKDEPAAGGTPAVFTNRPDLEAHFRRLHAMDAVTEVRDGVAPGNVARDQLPHVLLVLVRRAVDQARSHLFDFSQRLGVALEHRGLKLFKRRGGKLFVSRTKPRAIDPTVVFSERVARIVETIRQHPGIPISKLLESVAPFAPPPESASGAEAACGPDDAETKVEHPKLSDEQLAAVKDLRWLADEGYVIEYSDGAVFLGVQGEQAKKEDAKLSAAPANADGSVMPSSGETREPAASTMEAAEVAAGDSLDSQMGEPEAAAVMQEAPKPAAIG